jgi:hypothetical protein
VNFEPWVAHELALAGEDLERLHLVAAFQVMVCRCEAARRRGAPAPLVTVSPKLAGGNSRMLTRRMLGQLGYNRDQLRVIHRLLAGSTGGWEGLLGLFAAGQHLNAGQRGYARRQVQLFMAAIEPLTPSKTRQGKRQSVGRADWVT